MKVVLRDDVTGVGQRGDIVDVAPGFARNYLFPGGRAIEATKGITDQAAAMRRARDLRMAKHQEAAEAQAKVLDGARVELRARAGTQGRLFGSVTAADVAAAIEAQKGVEVDRRHVVLEEAIKSVGARQVPIALFGGVTATVTVEVVAEEV